MADDQKKSGASISNAIALWKDVISSLRDTALFILAVLLIAFPVTLNSVLEKAGFEEGSLAGFKWKSGLVNSDATLKEARAVISDLQRRNDEMTELLAQAGSRISDPAIKASIADLGQKNQQLLTASRQVEVAASRTIAENAPLVEKAMSVTSANTWGVVWSGDSNLQAAKYETDVIAPKLGLPNPSVYFRDGSYRSVSVVEDKQLAAQILGKAKLRRQDAYVVNMATWCPSSTQKPGYVECARR